MPTPRLKARFAEFEHRLTDADIPTVVIELALEFLASPNGQGFIRHDRDFLGEFTNGIIKRHKSTPVMPAFTVLAIQAFINGMYELEVLDPEQRYIVQDIIDANAEVRNAYDFLTTDITDTDTALHIAETISQLTPSQVRTASLFIFWRPLRADSELTLEERCEMLELLHEVEKPMVLLEEIHRLNPSERLSTMRERFAAGSLNDDNPASAEIEEVLAFLKIAMQNMTRRTFAEKFGSEGTVFTTLRAGSSIAKTKTSVTSKQDLIQGVLSGEIIGPPHSIFDTFTQLGFGIAGRKYPAAIKKGWKEREGSSDPERMAFVLAMLQPSTGESAEVLEWITRGVTDLQVAREIIEVVNSTKHDVIITVKSILRDGFNCGVPPEERASAVRHINNLPYPRSFSLEHRKKPFAERYALLQGISINQYFRDFHEKYRALITPAIQGALRGWPLNIPARTRGTIRSTVKTAVYQRRKDPDKLLAFAEGVRELVTPNEVKLYESTTRSVSRGDDATRIAHAIATMGSKRVMRAIPIVGVTKRRPHQLEVDETVELFELMQTMEPPEIGAFYRAHEKLAPRQRLQALRDTVSQGAGR